MRLRPTPFPPACSPLQPWVGLCLEVFHKQHSEAKAKAAVAVLWSTSRMLQQRVLLPNRAGAAAGPSNRADGQGQRDEKSEPAAASMTYTGPGKAWVKFYRRVLQDLADLALSVDPFGGQPSSSLSVMGGQQPSLVAEPGGGQPSSLSAAQLVDVLVALADLGFHPGERWLAEHRRHCDAVLMQMTSYQVRGLRP